MFSTNVTALINMTQAILPLFKARPDGGRGDIINIGSIAGREPYPGGSIYCATKAAVRSFTDALRKELIATRIRVIEIDPGQVETEFSVVRFGGDKEKARKVYEGVEPLTGEDIAEVVVFAAGRRENVVLADALVFPNHQVSEEDALWSGADVWWGRLRRRLCIGRVCEGEVGGGVWGVRDKVGGRGSWGACGAFLGWEVSSVNTCMAGRFVYSDLALSQFDSKPDFGAAKLCDAVHSAIDAL